MSTTKLYFATNRRHKGSDRWKPKRYGKNFSDDGRQNLRFGELTVNADDAKVNNFLAEKIHNRIGNGEDLADYLTRQAKRANISAYDDPTTRTSEKVPYEEHSSVAMFRDLKANMEKVADVVIYIHGFNVSWEKSVGSALALQYMLNKRTETDSNQKHVIVVLFSWPSDGNMKPYVAYFNDRDDAEGSGLSVGRGLLKLRDFLATLLMKATDERNRLCNQEIHLLCHSMGNYVLQNAVKKLIEDECKNHLPRLFQHIFLCAADVDDDVLEINQHLARLKEMCKYISIYYNTGDVAMYIADYTKFQPERLGHSGCAHLSMMHNKIHQIDCSHIVNGFTEHSYYLWATVNNDIRLSILGVPFNDNNRSRKQSASQPNIWEMI